MTVVRRMGPRNAEAAMIPRRSGPDHTLWLAGLSLLLLAVWILVYSAGGTQSAWPHAFYLPVVLATVPFGRKGALAAGMAATILSGPLMPLDVAAGVAQQPGNWVVRGLFLLGIGLVSGTTVESLHRAVRGSVAERMWYETERAAAATTLPDLSAGSRIRRVLAERSLETVFQPIYSLCDGRLLAVEALSRFEDHPRRTPDVWFEEAAAVGMGVDLDLVAIEMALEGARALPAGVALHVNASPSTLRDPRLIRLVLDHSDREIVVEVTEHAAIDDYARLELARARLRAHGIQLAVDDAGAGFASLRHIVRLAPDIIKVDQSLVQGLGKDHFQAAMAEALVQFAHRTGIVLIAEGVEERADLSAWKRLGAHAGQGYLLGRPSSLPPTAAPYVVAEPAAIGSPRSTSLREQSVV